MADNVAHLFEPNERFHAIDYVKKLYRRRSEILHGSDIDANQDERENARVLAAAVLQAVIERRQYVRRKAGHRDESPSELMAALESHLTRRDDSGVYGHLR